MQRSRSEYSIINILTGFGGYFLNTIMGYICRMVFVRCLSAEYLGVNGLFTNILSMLSLAELGIGGAIGFALYKPLAEDDRDKIATLMRFYGKAYRIIGCVVAVVGLLMMPFLNIIITEQPDIQENLYVIYLLYLFNTASTYFFSYRSALLTAAQRNYIVLGINYAVTIMQSIIQIPMLLMTHNYMAYLIVQTIGVFVNNVIVSWWAKKDYPYISKRNVKPLSHDEKRGLFINIKALTINKLSTILVNNTDNIVLTYFSGLVAVGVVSNYVILTNTLSSLTSQLFNSLTASVGNLNAIENDEKKYSFFQIHNLSNFWIFGWGAIGIAFVSGDIVRLCFGEEYVLGISIPLVLAINFYIVGMQNAVYAYKNTMGLFRYGQYLLLLTAAINLVLDIVLGNTMGILGIYLATAVARIATNAWYEPYAVFHYGLKVSPFRYLRKYFEYIGVLVVTGGICYYLCSLCQFQVAINVIIKFIICSIVPNCIFFACYHKSEEGQYLIGTAKRFTVKLINKVRR
ncbi:hypothetical protein QVN96_08040 [Mediterraneibacter glycyrrhizinilyticus]|uniref:lipopolysaccharide biosynthesis protein n=1 Tax=Mediterraneibacter glycyrrhizinilyticus TaxID=342942 RepID=UPI0025AA5A30|nr:hypothetical protein [Mediterraneibacter glycyrrhizinilyticus]MDN0061357.1 hypothetical protein [Mediterraneibacter glycyrrhizinilyticus]